ncbi:MAG: nucleotide sugar dehydrogenase [Desulfobacteraceae bacterium]|nr:MAG: nucleotide sugar dehydrogenase [Desulfobacteraceae bacterium]
MDQTLKRMVFKEDDQLKIAIDCCLAGAKKVGFCVNDTGCLVGILTEGDILRVIREGASLNACAGDFINRKPVSISERVSIPEAKRMMGKKIQILPRVDTENRLIGYVDMSSYEYGFIDIKNRAVLILGLGYVGLTLGLVLADNGFLVNGWDTNKALMEKLKKKKSPFFEAGLQDFIDRHIGRNFRLVEDLQRSRSDICVITVGTPVDPVTKEPLLHSIRNAVQSVGSVLAKDNLVVLRSTIMVGTTRNLVIPELEKASGLKAGKDFFVAFCPERTAEGRALKELKYLPQIIGGLEEKSSELASRFFNTYTPTTVSVESLEAAELCKLIDNSFRDVRFAFANQVAEIGEGLGINIHRVIEAVNLNYSRNDIPKPSPGVGGPCLIKDPYILRKLFRNGGLEAPLIEAARKVNEAGPERVVRTAADLLKKAGKDLRDSKAFIVGFAFKGEPETSDLRDSTTLWLLKELKKYTKNIAGYDPVAFPEEMDALGIQVVGVEDGFRDADVVFIMNNHQSYLRWDIESHIALMRKPALIYDCWRLFSNRQIIALPDVIYAGIGVASGGALSA